MPEDGSPRPDRGRFGSVVLAGLVTSAAAALVSTRSWFGGGQELVGTAQPGMVADGAESSYPAATGVALVLLASWGVLLVTRGRVRRGFAVVALLAAVGLVVTVVTAGVDPPRPSRILPGDAAPADPSLTAWFWVAAVLSVLAVAPAALAVRLCPRWPEMGSRYDAPADASAASARSRPEPDGPATDRDLWRSLDEGRDPTEPVEPPHRPLD